MSLFNVQQQIQKQINKIDNKFTLNVQLWNVSFSPALTVTRNDLTIINNYFTLTHLKA